MLSRNTRRVAAAATTLVLVGGVAVAIPTSASAATAPSPTIATIVTPLLNIFETGDATGLPLACNLATSLVLTGASQINAGTAVSSIATQIVQACNDLSNAGSGYLSKAIAESKAFTFINPVLDPAIESMATGVTTAGTNDAQALAPFGPTISGLGGDIAFFEGD